MAAPPKVFVSYSHDSPEHANRVLDLADRLRAEGIEATIDQYEPHPAEGWPLWMERQIRDADFVLLVCTETYARRVARAETPGVGRGATWEGNLIYQHLYSAGMQNTKFVPVLFDPADQAHIPTPLQGATSYLVGSQDGYARLYRRLTGQPETAPAPLGTLRQLPPRARQHSGPLPELLPKAARGALSVAERLALIQKLNALPGIQLGALVFTLNPPPGLVPPETASAGSRVSALLNWAEGTGGCGLAAVQQTLAAVLSPP